MKFLPLVWAGIWRRRARAILTLLSIVSAFLLLGILQGFQSGIKHAIAETHADVLYTFSKVSQIEPLPMAQAAQIKMVPGVSAVVPLIIFQSSYQNPANVVRAFAVDARGFFAAEPALKISPAQLDAMTRTRTGAVVGAEMMGRYGWHVGQRVPLKSLLWSNSDGSPTWPVDIVGTYTTSDKTFGANAMLVNYDYVDQGRTTAKGTAGFFLVRVSDPNRASQISAQIDKLFANSPHETKTATERQMAQEQLKQIGDIGFVINAIVGAVFFALLFSVGAGMMQSMRERTPELAVLKTLGFTDGAVLALILTESLIFCVFSGALGLVLASGLFPLAKSQIGFAIQVGPVMFAGLLFAVALAVLSGLPPAIRGMRLQVVDALAGR